MPYERAKIHSIQCSIGLTASLPLQIVPWSLFSPWKYQKVQVERTEKNGLEVWISELTEEEISKAEEKQKYRIGCTPKF